jgi:hypothetical protein
VNGIEREIAERREFLQRLSKLGELGDEHLAACDAEMAATIHRNATRKAYVQYWIETEAKFPGKRMPFYAESLWGPKKV